MTQSRGRGKTKSTDKRNALIQAAVRLVERDGISALTTRKIADEAGVPLGTVHYWFADKESLLAEVVQIMIAEGVRTATSELDGDGSLDDQLLAFYRRLLEMPRERQLALFEVTTHAVRTPGLESLAHQQYESYDQVAREAIGPARDRADAVLPGGSEALAVLLLAVLDGLTLRSIAVKDDSAAEAAVTLLSSLLRQAGLDPEAASTPTP